MPAPAVGRRPRYLPDGVMPVVDWSHPLTACLDSYVIPRNGNVRDLVTGTSPDSVAPAPTAVTALSTGRAVNFGTTGAFWTLTSKPAFNVPFSVFVVAVSPGSTFKFFASYTGTGVGGRGWKFGSSASATRMGLTFGGVADYQFALNTLPAGNVEMTCGVSIEGTTATGYLNGANIGSLTVGTLVNANFRGLGLGAAVSNADAVQEQTAQAIGVVGVWRRPLSDQEMSQLHVDPFCMLRF